MDTSTRTLWRSRRPLVALVFAVSLIAGLMAFITPSNAGPAKSFSFGNSSYSYDENAGTVSVLVTRPGKGDWAGTVAVNITGGTADKPEDYSTTWGDGITLNFLAGEKTLPVQFTLIADGEDEPAESVELTLSNATAEVGSASVGSPNLTTLWIRDADPSGQTLAISDGTGADEDGGPYHSLFTVTLSGAAAAPVSVKYTTIDDTAAAPGDYTASSGVLVFAPGVTTQLIAVPVIDDTVDEDIESFKVVFSDATNAGISDAEGVADILDDDLAPTVSVDDAAAVWEGDTAAFTVDLSGPSGKTITVDYGTAPSAATVGACPGADVESTSGTLTFLAGETSKPVNVLTCEDSSAEANEGFFLNLGTLTNVTAADDSGIGVVKDDEPGALSLTFDNPTPSANTDLEKATAHVTNTSGDTLDGVLVRFEYYVDGTTPFDGSSYDQVNIGGPGGAGFDYTNDNFDVDGASEPGEAAGDATFDFSGGSAESLRAVVACVASSISATPTCGVATDGDAPEDTFSGANTGLPSLPNATTDAGGVYFPA